MTYRQSCVLWGLRPDTNADLPGLTGLVMDLVIQPDMSQDIVNPMKARFSGVALGASAEATQRILRFQADCHRQSSMCSCNPAY
jgi:hypothetical protein